MVYNDRNNSKPKRQEEIIRFYVFKEKELSELIKDEAEEFAKGIKRTSGKKDAYTQIRRFYDELVRIQIKSKDDNDSFNKYLPAIYIIASQAAYAKARKTLSESFKEFIVKNVKEIKNKDDLNNFILYFEAILGYLKYYKK